MPSNATAKTKSAPRSNAHQSALPTSRSSNYGFRATLRRNRTQILLTLGVSLLPLLIWGLAFLMRDNEQQMYTLTIDTHPELPHGQGHYNGGAVVSRPWVYHLKGVYKEADLARGLSGTKKLAFNQGMIFLFDKTAERCFWMKDMNYNLDIIWTDGQKRITAIEHSVAPSTYPHSFCHDAQFVIELNAGEADKSTLEPGQLLDF